MTHGAIKPILILLSVALAGLCSFGCGRSDSTRPVKISGLDVADLAARGRISVAARDPAVSAADLVPRFLMYTCFPSRTGGRTQELFEVRFRIRGSERDIESDGERAMQVQEMDVILQGDGTVNEGGVTRIVSSYAAADLNLLSRVGETRYPLRGPDIRPGDRASPARPELEIAQEIAANAIRKFQPATDFASLQFDRFTFLDIVDPGSGLTGSCYTVTYWSTNNLKVTATASRVSIDGEQVTVRIEAGGRVNRDGVTIQPLHFAYNREALEEWRRNAAQPDPGQPGADEPDAPASPMPPKER